MPANLRLMVHRRLEVAPPREPLRHNELVRHLARTLSDLPVVILDVRISPDGECIVRWQGSHGVPAEDYSAPWRMVAAANS